MLTDKEIEREEAFCDDWYMVRKMGKTPTYADAIAWADKTMIEKACEWLKKWTYQDCLGVSPIARLKVGFSSVEELIEDFRKAMED